MPEEAKPNGEARLQLLEHRLLVEKRRNDDMERDLRGALAENTKQHQGMLSQLDKIDTSLRWLIRVPSIVVPIIVGLLVYIFTTHSHP